MMTAGGSPFCESRMAQPMAAALAVWLRGGKERRVEGWESANLLELLTTPILLL